MPLEWLCGCGIGRIEGDWYEELLLFLELDAGATS